MDQESLVEPPRNVYAFDGQMLIMAAIATVFLFVVFLVGLHVYARWWLRRGASARRTHVFVLADTHHPASADRGLDPAVLRSLPVFTFSSKAAPAEQEQGSLLECAVCLSEFEESEIGRLLPKCRHSFHIDCIDMWFHSHSTCPLCRSPVESLADPPPAAVVVEVVEGSTSGSGMCEACEHEEGSETTSSLARRRKAAGVKIEVIPHPRIESESTQGSPMTARMMSFKRLLSMGGMSSPSGGRASPRYRAGTSRAAAAAAAVELDLESGLGEAVRVYTPK